MSQLFPQGQNHTCRELLAYILCLYNRKEEVFFQLEYKIPRTDSD